MEVVDFFETKIGQLTGVDFVDWALIIKLINKQINK